MPNDVGYEDTDHEPQDQVRLTEVHSFQEFRDAGLLWLVNRVVFHPRGYALAFQIEGTEVVGWTMIGDGVEPWVFTEDDDNSNFEKVNMFFEEHHANVSEA